LARIKTNYKNTIRFPFRYLLQQKASAYKDLKNKNSSGAGTKIDKNNLDYSEILCENEIN